MATSDFIQAESLACSLTPTGERLDTLRLRYPRIIHSELMTHRVFSRNASSSRAVPVKKLLADAPYIPLFQGNQPGMQGKGPMSADKQRKAEDIWMRMAAACHDGVQELAALGVHKQHANRPLEWFGFIDVVVSSSDWVNFTGLRAHGAAQPEFEVLANKIVDVLNASVARPLFWQDWHLPFITDDDREDVEKFVASSASEEVIAALAPLFKNLFLPRKTRLLIIMSAARCARASYRDFDGSKVSIERDVGTALKLWSTPVHATPFEHQARPATLHSGVNKFCGNFSDGWEQFRKFLPNERITVNHLLTYGNNPDIESHP